MPVDPAVSRGSASSSTSTFKRIALAALLIAVGNVASRVLGMGRMSVIAYFFGRSASVDAYIAALTIPVTLYDLLINGAISAALVPVFSEHAEKDPREFWRIVASVVSIALLALLVLVLLLEWQAPLVVGVLVQRADIRPQTLALVRLMLPAVLCMGLAGLITSVLYARQRFLLPAFAGATFNAGIIVGAVLLHCRLHIASLAVGMLIGALGQVVLQLPGLRDMPLRVVPTLRHPVVRRILRLYAPVALGIGFSIVGTLIDRWLASGFPNGLSTMQYATTMIQFPLGLVAAAVSLAVLPTLSRLAASAEHEAFRRTLAMGIKVVLLLIVPATAGLAALTAPITALLFQYGAFESQDTAATALALLLYLPGLPAAAIDQVLIFSFYARQKTLTPNLVQGAAVGFYLLTALPLLHFTSMGFLALIVGNAVQWVGHALLMIWLTQRSTSLRGLRLGEAAGKALLASALMAGAVVWLSGALWPLTAGLPHRVFWQMAGAGGAGLLIYLALCAALRVEALGFFIDALRGALGRKFAAR